MALRAAGLALGLAAAGLAHAQGVAWDRPANIETAAVHLADLQRGKGAMGAYQFISACYQTHQLAGSFGAPLEACLVQDYINSKITAAVYDKVPAAERQKMGLPEPQELVGTMLQRFGRAMAAYKLTEADARDLIAQIDQRGIPAFVAARFPKSE